MRLEAELSLRRLLLTVSTFVFLAASLAIYSLRLLPHDLVHLRTSLVVYLVFFLAVSLTGLVAAVKRNATLITIFAIHLLVDTVLFLIPRILLLRFSFSLPSVICSSSKYPDPTTDEYDVAAGTLGHATAKLENSIKQLSSPAWSEGSCLVWLWSLEVVFVALVVLHVCAQTLLGIRLFGYAAWLGRKKRLERVVCERALA